MKSRYFKLVVLLSFLLNASIVLSQEGYVTLEIENIYPKGFDSIFKVEINGISIDFDKDSVLIEKKYGLLDTVLLHHYLGNWTSKSLVLLKTDSTYIINVNSCSFYEIRPKHNFKKGAVRFNLMNSQQDSLLCQFSYYHEEIYTDFVSKYFSYHPSGMCRYASQKVGINYSKRNSSHFGFHFLHGEKITVISGQDDNISDIIFDGYIQGENYRVMNLSH